jgi:Methyltransferase domain
MKIGPGGPVEPSTTTSIIFLYANVPVRARYGYDRPPHPGFSAMMERHRPEFRAHLHEMLAMGDKLAAIPARAEPGKTSAGSPVWINDFFRGMDCAALYTFLGTHNPPRFVEVGSGYSTAFARRAVSDLSLRTEIISIDPEPRAEIDRLCDRVIRRPVQDVDGVFTELESGDILFIDSSHVVLQNSDVVTLHLDVLPALPPGVLIHIHDVFWPYDYPPRMTGLFFSEQYLVGAALLAEGTHYRIRMANYFAYRDPELSGILAPLWERLGLSNDDIESYSLWLEKA